jgi:hypothetical protein
MKLNYNENKKEEDVMLLHLGHYFLSTDMHVKFVSLLDRGGGAGQGKSLYFRDNPYGTFVNFA